MSASTATFETSLGWKKRIIINRILWQRPAFLRQPFLVFKSQPTLDNLFKFTQSRCVLVAGDYFTKQTEAYEVQNQDAKTKKDFGSVNSSVNLELQSLHSSRKCVSCWTSERPEQPRTTLRAKVMSCSCQYRGSWFNKETTRIEVCACEVPPATNTIV